LNVHAAVRRFFTSAAAQLTMCVVTAIIGIVIGWVSRGVATITKEVSIPAAAAATIACRDEVMSVDNARGAVSCSQPDMVSELKDGYLICRCRKK
jgi:hypothetical protein